MVVSDIISYVLIFTFAILLLFLFTQLFFMSPIPYWFRGRMYKTQLNDKIQNLECKINMYKHQIHDLENKLTRLENYNKLLGIEPLKAHFVEYFSPNIDGNYVYKFYRIKDVTITLSDVLKEEKMIQKLINKTNKRGKTND